MFARGHTVDRKGAAEQVIRLLTILAMTVAFGMLALGGVVLFDARRDAWHLAELSAQNLVTALERDIARTIAVYDLSLQGAIDSLQHPGLDSVSPEIRHSAIFDRAASTGYLGSLLVLDETGAITADSTALVPHVLDLSDRDYFQVHRDRLGVGLFVSRPFASRLRGGDASMAISRRLPDHDGAFAGVVVGTMRLAYFQELFSKLDLGPNSAVSLVRPDGELIVRVPPWPATVGTDQASPNPMLAHYQAQPAGSFVATYGMDGVTRLASYRQVGSLPMIIVVALAVDDIYAAWWRKAVGIGTILSVLCGATVVLCLLFRRELARRMDAEQALMDTAEKLSVMASTDELTGLANRRAFEAEIFQEWRRAMRAGTVLGVLMLDADWFKAFNDRYGHQEGDEVLRKIAVCIQKTIRRPGDTAARYGGEEFVVLLPDTSKDGAVHIARRMCSSLEALGIPHEPSPLGRVTLSIGIAILDPGSGETDQSLLRRADQALYEAKRAGRDRLCVAEAWAAAKPATVSAPL